MKTTRMEAFSDGVLAIVITIMVLELKVPHEADWSALRPLLPVVGSYVMSFVYVAIYWNNHHHLLNATDQIDSRALWANMHLLFWLSLIPFVTGWMGENNFAAVPTAVYGFVLLMAGCAWWLLQTFLVHSTTANQQLKDAVGRDFKGKLSLLIYAIGTALAFIHPWLSLASYILVAAMWFIPDRRLEKALDARNSKT